MASLTRWTWVWVNCRSWWWTGRPVVLRFMRSQRVGQDWATELNWAELNWNQSPPSDFTQIFPLTDVPILQNIMCIRYAFISFINAFNVLSPVENQQILDNNWKVRIFSIIFLGTWWMMEVGRDEVCFLMTVIPLIKIVTMTRSKTV